MGHQDLPRWLGDDDRSKLEETRQLAAEELTSLAMNGEPGRVNRPLIKALGGFGVLPQIFPADGTVSAVTLCLLREGLAGSSTDAETSFALQGLGAYPIVFAGSDEVKRRWIPQVASGEAVAGFALTEPKAGTDAGAMSLSAEKVDGGYRLSGTKKRISNAPEADVYSIFARTSESGTRGVTGFVLPGDTEGLAGEPLDLISPHAIGTLELDGVFVPDDHVLGEVDGAWKQATSELAYERSGPERFLETYYVLTELVRAVGNNPDTRSAEGIGRLVAQVHTMRRMSVSVAGMLQAGKEPVVEASIVKDIGTVWEQQLPHRVRELAAFVEETATNRETLEKQLSFAIKTAPKLTIQGGTTEVLRGIIARGLGLR